MATYLLFMLARPLVARLPSSALTAVGIGLGAACYALARPARQAVERNLKVVLPHATERERRRTALWTFVHGAWGYLELLKISRSSPQAIAHSYRFEGWDHLDAALAPGRGVIMAISHIGPSSIAGQLVGTRGTPTAVVVEPLRPPAMHRLIVGQREAFGVRMIPADRSAVREIVSMLRGGGIVGIACDRDVAGSGETFPFFGRSTRVTTAPATLARRTGAAIVPGVAYRTRPFAGTGRLGPPVEVPRSDDPVEDVREGTRRLTARIEAFIRERPEQWTVFSDVWPQPD